MLWLDHPPVWRWLGASLLVVVAAWSEFAPVHTTPHPYAARDIAAGTPLTDDLFEWRETEVAGLAVTEPTGVAAADIRRGDLLLASLIGERTIPEGWLVIAAPLPERAVAGSDAVAVIIRAPGDGSPQATFPALVVGSPSGDPFGAAPGQLAVPPEWMPRAAAAVTEGRLVVGVAGR